MSRGWVLAGVLGLVFLEGWGASRLWAMEPVWENKTGDLAEVDIRRVAFFHRGPEMLAASSRRVYRRTGAESSWKQVVGVRPPDQIVDLLEDPALDKGFWLVTQRSIRHTEDGGKTWKTLFQRPSEAGFQIRCIALDAAGQLYFGTTEGLYQFSSAGGANVARVEGSPKNTAIDAVAQRPDGRWIVLTARGIYEAEADWQNWVLKEGGMRSGTPGEDGPLNQFAIEEISAVSVWAKPVVSPHFKEVFAGRPDGLWRSAVAGSAEFQRIPETHGFRIRRIAADEKWVYLATDRGVYRLDPSRMFLENISQGLESLDVLTVDLDGQGGLWAGTRKGLFYRSAVPNTIPATERAPHSEPYVPYSEPTVREIQEAAIRYAEVSPDKIRVWRDAAAKKAWLPSVSLRSDLSEDENIDIDRGGTNDPDRFIAGPREKSMDWSVGVSWDLGELVWNDDQTSIDARSRLMVELRNDILNDITHLYFERRRAQDELHALPADMTKLRYEKEMKLQELTAQIDAMTGGELSRRMEREAESA